MRRLALPVLLALLVGCNADPGEVEQQVGYRDQEDEGPTSGERGNVIITEVLWSGSVKQVDGEWRWDPDDVFVEIRNQGALPVNIAGWYLQLDGAIKRTYRLPEQAFDPDPDDGVEPTMDLGTGEQKFFVAKTSGCFPAPDGIIEDFELPTPGDPFELTLRDFDERLMEPVGSETMPPFAGGYDLVVSRSMERINLMFGDRGTSPHMWHHYTDNEPVDHPNDDRIAEDCRARTLASPGRPNSPDYSGAYASGGFE